MFGQNSNRNLRNRNPARKEEGRKALEVVAPGNVAAGGPSKTAGLSKTGKSVVKKEEGRKALEEVAPGNIAGPSRGGKLGNKAAPKPAAKLTKPAGAKSTKTATAPAKTAPVAKPKVAKPAAPKPLAPKKALAPPGPSVPPATRKTRSSDVKPIASSSSDQITDQTTGVHSKRKSRTSQAAGILKDFEQEVVVAKKVKTIPHDNLDEEDENDPMMVSEYVNEIFEYLRELEIKAMPNPNYMENQKELQWKMRGILVDWIIEVHSKFRLLPETLYLGINIIDRFLSQRVVSLVKLQLVGITALFIASKYEEVISPSLSSFLYMAEESYTEEEIIKAERYVLQVLDFNLQYPTPMSFLRRSSKADAYDIQTRTVAKYLMEITLLDYKCLEFSASCVAAAGHYLARHMLNREEWNANLVYYSGYDEEELVEISSLILTYLSKPCKHEAVFKKYSSRKFMKCAIFVKKWVADHQTCLHPMRNHEMNQSDLNIVEIQEVESEEEEESDEE